jgi:hypothetical protein
VIESHDFPVIRALRKLQSTIELKSEQTAHQQLEKIVGALLDLGAECTRALLVWNTRPHGPSRDYRETTDDQFNHLQARMVTLFEDCLDDIIIEWSPENEDTNFPLAMADAARSLIDLYSGLIEMDPTEADLQAGVDLEETNFDIAAMFWLTSVEDFLAVLNVVIPIIYPENAL